MKYQRINRDYTFSSKYINVEDSVKFDQNDYIIQVPKDTQNIDAIIWITKYATEKLGQKSIKYLYFNTEQEQFVSAIISKMQKWISIPYFYGAGLALYFIDPETAERKYIVAHRPASKNLAFPGGKSEWYENNTECAERETREEWPSLKDAVIKVNEDEEIWPNSYTAEISYDEYKKLKPNEIFTKIYTIDADTLQHLYDGGKYAGLPLRK